MLLTLVRRTAASEEPADATDTSAYPERSLVTRRASPSGYEMRKTWAAGLSATDAVQTRDLPSGSQARLVMPWNARLSRSSSAPLSTSMTETQERTPPSGDCRATATRRPSGDHQGAELKFLGA